MHILIKCAAVTLGLAPGIASAAELEGDPSQGAQVYRACVSCHSLEPGRHLSGPSLTGLWGRTAGSIEGFTRYSPGLAEADFAWDAATLDAWIADPEVMIPGTYMTFQGIDDAQARADLVAFLELAMQPGGHETVVERGMIPAQFARGQGREPLGAVPEGAKVAAVRHCGDGFMVETRDGSERAFWEMNVRLKIDSTETGPEPGQPVIMGAGMRGDRVFIIFSSVADLVGFVTEGC